MTDLDSNELVARVTSLVEREAGIVVPANPKFIQNRLARLDPETIRRGLLMERGALTALVAVFCTHETRFFREPAHFEIIEQQFAPALYKAVQEGRHPRRVRAWTAACSSGEETYSLAMTLCDLFPRAAGWTVEVLATDVSDNILGRARSGTYSIDASTMIGADRLRRYMLRGSGPAEGTMCVSPQLAECVRFAQVNLTRPPYPVQGRFDLILCRNVLFYFRETTQRAVVNALSAHLEGTGILFTGHAESAAGHTPFLKPIAPATFVLSQAA